MNTATVDITKVKVEDVTIFKHGREVILEHSAEVTLTCPRCGHELESYLLVLLYYDRSWITLDLDTGRAIFNDSELAQRTRVQRIVCPSCKDEFETEARSTACVRDNEMTMKRELIRGGRIGDVYRVFRD